MSEPLDLRKVLQQAREQIARDAREVAASGAPSVAELQPHFPEFEFGELLGVGGMGAVFRARDRRHERDVAIKIVSAQLAVDPAFVERFDREARTLGQLDHPNIVRVFASGRSGPWLYLVMEYVDGVNLRRWMDLGSFTADAALGLLPGLCEALRHAHERGIVHRDIKPENILIDELGVVKLADFGLAKVDSEADWGVTRTNQALGTAHYMAPEQLQEANTVDHRADIFSLGVVVYEMLTGELPHGRVEPPSAKQPGLRGVDRVVLRSMDRDPERRYQSVEQFGRELQSSRGGGRGAPPAGARPAAGRPSEPPAELKWETLLAWIGFALFAAGLLVVGIDLANRHNFTLLSGIGFIHLAIGVVLGFAALHRGTPSGWWGTRLAAAIAAGFPAGLLFWGVAYWVLRNVLPLTRFGWRECYVLVALFSTLAWVIGATISGRIFWFVKEPRRAHPSRGRRAG